MWLLLRQRRRIEPKILDGEVTLFDVLWCHKGSYYTITVVEKLSNPIKRSATISWLCTLKYVYKTNWKQGRLQCYFIFHPASVQVFPQGPSSTPRLNVFSRLFPHIVLGYKSSRHGEHTTYNLQHIFVPLLRETENTLTVLLCPSYSPCCNRLQRFQWTKANW